MWSGLALWSPKAFVRNVWSWPDDQVRPLAHALVARKIAVNADGEGLKLLSLRFDGSMDERQATPDSLKGKLFLAEPGDVVFSKIDVRNGAIGIVPPTFDNAAFTAEFPIYRVRPDVADSRYIQLLFRSNFFRATINGMVSGASGRKRIAPAQLEAVRIPLPLLSVQQAIVSQWQALQDAAQHAAARADACEAAGREAFLRALGLEAPVIKDKVRAFAVRWSELERWGGEANRLGQRGGSVAAVAYPLVQGKDFIREVSHGCSASPSTQPTALEVLKISAVTKGWLDISEKKFAPDEPRLRMQFALKQGDVLLCRTNGTLAYVGAAALVEEDQSDLIYPDKVIRVRLQDNVVPAFFWQVLRTPYLRAQIESFARTAVGNYAIGGKDIWQFRIPLPPLNVQKNLVTAINDARAEAARLRSEAAQLRQQAQREIEAALLGHPLAERVDG